MSPDVIVDRISVLPHNIIDSILTRLEIKEAARTCILSRSWRYQWHFLSKVNINHEDFDGVSQIEFSSIIDRILLLHRGSVDKLELHVDDLYTHNGIDRWILYVSRNGVRELVVDNLAYKHYNIPSCLFSCSGLTYLQLTRCMVKPPTTFKEFGKLTKLSFDEVVIDTKVLENLITSCPLLNQLCLEDVGTPRSVKINAAKLVMFHIYGFEYYPQFINTPLLDSACFGRPQLAASVKEDCKAIELLQSMAVLRKLELDHSALQHLAFGDVPACLPSVCLIRQLIVSIDFLNLRELQAVFCIFRSSPFVQHLQITASLPIAYPGWSMVSSDGFWKGENDFSFKFDHLQTVKVYEFTGTESELKFVKFILSNAPALKTMSFGYFRAVAKKAALVTKLIRFPRVSPNTEIILPPDWDL